MGASWLEVDRLIRDVGELCAFPHAEALAPVVRARDLVAATAMVVSLAALAGDARAEVEAHDALACARVAVLDAESAVRRAQEAVALSHAGRERAQRLMTEARALRARDRSRGTLTSGRADGLTRPAASHERA